MYALHILGYRGENPTQIVILIENMEICLFYYFCSLNSCVASYYTKADNGFLMSTNSA